MNDCYVPYDSIVVKLEYEDKIGDAGIIIIPDTAKQYHGDFYGHVYSVGVDSKSGLKAGDRIFYQRHEGREINVDGKRLVWIRPDHILAKVEDE